MPTAAILTGGLARRFDGRDKSELIVGGRSIFDRQLATLSQLSDDILVVSAHPASSGTRAWRAEHRGLRVIHDRVEDCGPLAGLDAALASAYHDVVVIMACDMPFVTAALLEHLLALTTEADAVVPLTDRGYHPLCAAYARTCSAAVERRLAGRQLAMCGLLDDLRVRSVTADELRTFGDPRRLLANVNTATEYARLTEQDPDASLSSHEAVEVADPTVNATSH